MESIGSLFVAALVRMHKDREHAELLLDLRLTSLGTYLENVIWIDELVIEQSVKLVVLIEL